MENPPLGNETFCTGIFREKEIQNEFCEFYYKLMCLILKIFFDEVTTADKIF